MNFVAKLPSAAAKMAGEGGAAKNLDQVTVNLTPLSAAVAAIPTAAENADAVWNKVLP